jgi:hypothetical protein
MSEPTGMELLMESGPTIGDALKAAERRGYLRGIEDAAKVCRSVNSYANPMTANDCSDAILALKDKP